MSIYNKYAVHLDAAFKTARGKFAKAFEEYEKAKEKLKALEEKQNRMSAVERLAPEKQISYLRTKADLKEKEEVLKTFNGRNGVWAEFNAEKERITAAFKKDVKEHYLLNPQALDNNAMELLKARVLTAADFENLEETYSENPTMLKMISKYAGEAAQNADISQEERQNLQTIKYRTEGGKITIEKAWDELIYITEICSGHAHETNPSARYVNSINNEWENISGELINNF